MAAAERSLSIPYVDDDGSIRSLGNVCQSPSNISLSPVHVSPSTHNVSTSPPSEIMPSPRDVLQVNDTMVNSKRDNDSEMAKREQIVDRLFQSIACLLQDALVSTKIQDVLLSTNFYMF